MVLHRPVELVELIGTWQTSVCSMTATSRHPETRHDGLRSFPRDSDLVTVPDYLVVKLPAGVMDAERKALVLTCSWRGPIFV